jgi:hypothetical protein
MDLSRLLKGVQPGVIKQPQDPGGPGMVIGWQVSAHPLQFPYALFHDKQGADAPFLGLFQKKKRMAVMAFGPVCVHGQDLLGMGFRFFIVGKFLGDIGAGIGKTLIGFG